MSKFLDTDQITKLANRDEVIKPYYLGCYPADVTPEGVRDKCCWVWNTDEADKPGSHWVGVAKQGKRIVFFDSYGKTPTFFKRNYWLKYFRDLGCRVTMYSDIQRQSHISRTCGVWFLVFLLEQWQSENILDTLQAEPHELLENERRLQKIAYHFFPPCKVFTKKHANVQKDRYVKHF